MGREKSNASIAGEKMMKIGNKNLGFILRSLLVGFLAILSFNSFAQVSITKISSSIQEGNDVFKVDLSAAYQGKINAFSVQSPARLVLDLPSVRNGLGKTMVDLPTGLVKNANLVEVADRTRLVLNLKQSSNHKIQQTGNILYVIFTKPEVNAIVANRPTVFAESLNEKVLTMTAPDFKRGTDGAGRLELTLPSNQVGIDIKQQASSLIIEILKSTIPDNLRRKLDVIDFGTPIQTITTDVAGDKVRIVIDNKGLWEHSVYQTDTKFVLEVRPQVQDPNKLSAGKGYTGEKLSLNFQNIEIRSLLQVIADFTNFNIITSDTVAGTVTLRLKDVPWDQALDIILQAKSLGVRKSGTVLWIAPKEELATKERQELESKAAIENLEPLRTQSFQLNYTKAAEISQQIAPSSNANNNGSRGLLSPRGSVIAEPRTNQIFVTDIASKLTQVEDMIKKLDIAIRQVVIEARIVEASDTFGKSLGVRWGGADLGGVRGGQAGDAINNKGQRIAFGGSYNAVASTTTEATNVLDTQNTQLVSLPATSLSGFNASKMAISLFSSVANRFLNLELSALEADGKGKVVSSPRVVTADQTKALIEQGTELPYEVSTASGATSIAFRKASLKLEVTPQITPEGNIILDLDVNKDSVGQSTTAGFAINTKHIKTQVLVENGGTVVIGGIFELTETDDEAKVPVLGDVPFLGNAFKTKTRRSAKQEMLVFITPRVISDQSVR